MVPHLEGMVLSPGHQPSPRHSVGGMSPCGHGMWDAHQVEQLPTHPVCLDGHEDWVTGAIGEEVVQSGHLRVSEPMIHLHVQRLVGQPCVTQCSVAPLLAVNRVTPLGLHLRNLYWWRECHCQSTCTECLT